MEKKIYDKYYEEALIGAVLVNPAAISDVLFVSPDDFQFSLFKKIWENILAIYRRGGAESVDIVTVAAESGVEPSELMALMMAPPSSSNAIRYAEVVCDMARRRKAMLLANEIAQAAVGDGEFSPELYAIRLAGLARGRGVVVGAMEAASRAVDAVVGESKVFTSGIRGLDERVGGLFASELSVIGGYQGSGKSAFVLQVARRNVEAGRKVLFFSLEMTPEQIWLRMACGDTGVDMNQVRARRVSEAMMGNVVNRAAELGEVYHGKLAICGGMVTLASMLSISFMERPDIVIVDHLKIIAGKPSDVSRNEFYSDALAFLRQRIAIDLGAHVMVVHQLNREATRERRAPGMHDLYMAGEDTPDLILLLHRKDDHAKPLCTLADVGIIVGKSRFGWTGEYQAVFNLPRQAFFDIAEVRHGN